MASAKKAAKPKAKKAAKPAVKKKATKPAVKKKAAKPAVKKKAARPAVKKKAAKPAVKKKAAKAVAKKRAAAKKQVATVSAAAHKALEAKNKVLAKEIQSLKNQLKAVQKAIGASARAAKPKKKRK